MDNDLARKTVIYSSAAVVCTLAAGSFVAGAVQGYNVAKGSPIVPTNFLYYLPGITTTGIGAAAGSLESRVNSNSVGPLKTAGYGALFSAVFSASGYLVGDSFGRIL